MKINSKILSIPPYISTSWKNIASLHLENHDSILILIVTLLNGTQIQIPQLQPPIIEAIFAAHAKYIEQEQAVQPPKGPSKLPNLQNGMEQTLTVDLPFKAIPGLENFGGVLQHNPEQGDTPDLPPDFLEKISSLSHTVGIEDPNAVPQPEPHCNCVHCQIARALQKGLTTGITDQTGSLETIEEVISDEDLKFRLWDIQQTGDKLFAVSNPEDTEQHYSVYLGEPIGCTCGEKHCEHIQAVLKS